MAGPPTTFDPHLTPRVYLSAEVPAVGGRLKERPEDFYVEELPAYEPCGEGEHLYLFVEKRMLSTLRVVRLLADHFDVAVRDVGYAGLKDRRAVTRQVFSVHLPGRDASEFPAVRHDGLTVLWADRHANKLRRGHLAGNGFSIRIRAVSMAGVLHARRVLDLLARVGAPNRIGEQRFGYARRNHLVGRALILGDAPRALDALLGPLEAPGDSQAAGREAYARGDFGAAIGGFFRESRTERRALGVLARGRKPHHAIAAIDEADRGFFVTAFQSAVFNAVLDERIDSGTLGALGEGDLAFRHDNGSLFAVTSQTLGDPDTAQRLARLEISPSGPMWGPSMLRASGATDAREVEALGASGVTLEQMAVFGSRCPGMVEGSRRPLRVPLHYPDVEGGVDEHGPYIRCAFELPRGAFATTVMQEIMKPADAAVAGPSPEEDERAE